MTGALVGVIVGVVAVAAWVGGRRWGAVLPRKSDQPAVLPRKSDQGSLNFPETDTKVIQGPAGDRNLQKKVIARAKPAAESPRDDQPAEQKVIEGEGGGFARAKPAAESPAAEQKVTEGEPAADSPPDEHHDEPAESSADGPRDEPAKPPARVLVGARPDAGTTLRLDAPPEGWPEWVNRDREDGQLLDVAGRTVEVSLRGTGDEVVAKVRERVLCCLR